MSMTTHSGVISAIFHVVDLGATVEDTDLRSVLGPPAAQTGRFEVQAPDGSFLQRYETHVAAVAAIDRGDFDACVGDYC